MTHEPRRKMPEGTIDQHEGRDTGHDHADGPPSQLDHRNQPQRAQPDVCRCQEVEPCLNFGGGAKILIDRNTQKARDDKRQKPCNGAVAAFTRGQQNQKAANEQHSDPQIGFTEYPENRDIEDDDDDQAG